MRNSRLKLTRVTTKPGGRVLGGHRPRSDGRLMPLISDQGQQRCDAADHAETLSRTLVVPIGHFLWRSDLGTSGSRLGRSSDHPKALRDRATARQPVGLELARAVMVSSAALGLFKGSGEGDCFIAIQAGKGQRLALSRGSQYVELRRAWMDALAGSTGGLMTASFRASLCPSVKTTMPEPP